MLDGIATRDRLSALRDPMATPDASQTETSSDSAVANQADRRGSVTEPLGWPTAHNNCVPAIFLSYRRSDSVGAAGRLFDRLAEHFGADQVFRDIDSIEAGEDFEESIRDALRLATVVLVVIGPRWLEARSQDGTRRIDDPADYVRHETEAARSSDTAVVPLLVEGAALPARESVPTSVKALALRKIGSFPIHEM